VIPILGIADSETLMDTWISRVHSLIIGPGLGRSENAFKSVKIALACAKKQNIPVTIDADGLYVLSFDTSLIKGYEKCILTPNAIEFKRIYDSEFKNEAEYDENKNFSNIELQCEAVQRLAKKLENVTIFKKGAVDIISDGRKVILSGMDSNGEYTNEGMPKRCGGIGDLLSGTIGTFSYWSSNYAKSNEEENEQINSNLIACFSASRFIKACSKVAFEKCHRSVLAVDIIEEIGNVFFNIYDATK
jgi:ATP-dependent NAD(P)H-hydrate dehydratase